MISAEQIDYDKFEIMGVKFSSKSAFEKSLNALATNMYEGLVLSTQFVEIYRDYIEGKINQTQMIERLKELAQT